MGEVIDLIPKRGLTEEQTVYWEQQLEIYERKVEYAKRQLGMLALEGGISE